MPESKVGQAWDEHFQTSADTYRVTEGVPLLRKIARSPFVQLMRRQAGIGPGSRVLEAGCASAKFSMCFAMLGCQVTALDFSRVMLRNAAELKQATEREVGPLDVTFVEGDLEHLDLEPD